VPTWLLGKTLYVREIRSSGLIIVSTLKTGAVTGAIKPEYLTLEETSTETSAKKPDFKPYLVMVTANSLNVRNGAGTQYKITTAIKKGQVYTIIDEKNGWGKLKSGTGWIYLDEYTKKL
jgi:N-acetylmuramoyl-L-alanine amidase